MTGKEIYEILKREFPASIGWFDVHSANEYSLGYNNSGYIVCYKRGGKYSFSYNHDRNLLNIGIL